MPRRRREIIHSFWESEGIILNKAKISYNTANRVWRNFALTVSLENWPREIIGQTTLISDPKELQISGHADIELLNLVVANDDVVWFSLKFSAEGHVLSMRHSNGFIEAFVAAGPLIHLYRYLDRLQENVIHFGTYCYIYSAERQTRSRWNWTKWETWLPNLNLDYISEFVSRCPKNYAYMTMEFKPFELIWNLWVEGQRTMCTWQSILRHTQIKRNPSVRLEE